jgi:hypothetical protein
MITWQPNYGDVGLVGVLDSLTTFCGWNMNLCGTHLFTTIWGTYEATSGIGMIGPTNAQLLGRLEAAAFEAAVEPATSVYRTARLGLGQRKLENGLDPVNFATGDRSAYVGDEAAARTLANPDVGNFENFYTRFDMDPAFEREFAKYMYPYPEGGPGSYEYQIPQSLIPRFNELTLLRTPIPFVEEP